MFARTSSSSRETLREAWQFDGLVSWDNRYIVVTDPDMGVEHTDAGNRVVRGETQVANRGIRETTGSMLDTPEYQRTRGAPGHHDAPSDAGIRDVDVGRSDDGTQAAADTAACIDAFGDGAAFRSLYAEALETLSPDAAIGGGQANRMAAIAEEWTDVAAILRDAEGAEPALDGAASVVQEIAERERTFFEYVREAL